MFSLKHILILSVCIVYIVLTWLFLKRKRPSLRTVQRCVLGVGLLSETLKVVTYITMNEQKYGGYLPKTDLPFHLCSVQIIFILILVLSENEKLKRVLYSFMLPTCLIGGIAALLIPTSSSLNNDVIMVQYFLYHSTLILYAIDLYLTDEISFTLRDFRNCLLMLYGIFFMAIYLNSWVNDYSHPINFMYVVRPPVEGLPFLNRQHGWLVYIVRYAAVAVFAAAMCYIKPITSGVTFLLNKSKDFTHGSRNNAK